jgi:ATP-dependent DNA helicase UvrD/PcrA
MFDLKNDLNQSQTKAATHIKGPQLVIAGAGSGKTRVITYRVANLVENHGVAPWRILAVTFTNKASREMKDRVEQLLGGKGTDCWVSTFHSVCAKLLRIHGELVGINPKFTIYDDGDQKAMVVRCLKELQVSDKTFPPRAIQNEINRAKQNLVGANEYQTGDFYRENIQKIYELYEKRMHDASALDFGDLLYRIVRGMKENQELLNAINGRFDYILVDEFQDTNHVQLEFVQLLTQPHGNICVVGDDDQSIYSWRGADVANILEFEKFFPGAVTVTLDRNYRSTANILKAAHGVVNKLHGRRKKELWTSDADGEKISFIEAADEREEGRLVARAIRDTADDGVPLSEQAVFYRINAQSRVFEEIFRTMGIPHRVVGGMRFYERAEVKDMLAYLRLVQNSADLAAFLRVVNKPTRGIGKTTVEKLLALAAGHGISAYEAIGLAEKNIGRAPAKKLVAFAEMIDNWRAEIDLGPVHLAGRVLEDTGYSTGLTQENSAEADARLENIRELIGSIEDFEAEAEIPSLSNFLELVSLQSDIDTTNFEGEQVTLMTIHSAKGLEFDVVHVTGLEEGLFPYGRPGDQMADSPEEMDEERRLCYVAMTRARKQLFLHRARTRRLFGQAKMNPPSRFLMDIPPDLLRDLTPDRPQIGLLGRSTSTDSSKFGRPRPTARPQPQHAERQRTTTKDKRHSPNETWVDRSYDQTAENSPLQTGSTVRHARFGIGEVIAVHPGVRPKIEVRFPGFGKKTILADYLQNE